MSGARKKETPETAFRKKGMKWLKKRFHGVIWSYRTVGGPTQRNGVPDDLVCIRGHFVAIEWKQPEYRPGKKKTDQDKEIERIQNAGGRAAKVWTDVQLRELVDGIEPVQKDLFE